jgi:hypothetical protein
MDSKKTNTTLLGRPGGQDLLKHGSLVSRSRLGSWTTLAVHITRYRTSRRQETQGNKLLLSSSHVLCAFIRRAVGDSTRGARGRDSGVTVGWRSGRGGQL